MNANDTLREYSCTDNYYKFNSIMVITDGVKALADRFECYWFLDIIASHWGQLRKADDFQVWKIQKHADDSATVTCDDGNGNVLKTQMVLYTDFKPTTATVWVEDRVMLLPSEH